MNIVQKLPSPCQNHAGVSKLRYILNLRYSRATGQLSSCTADLCRTEPETTWLVGDLLVLGGATLYGISNVWEEYIIRTLSRVEFLGMIESICQAETKAADRLFGKLDDTFKKQNKDRSKALLYASRHKENQRHFSQPFSAHSRLVQPVLWIISLPLQDQLGQLKEEKAEEKRHTRATSSQVLHWCSYSHHPQNSGVAS
ncbi:hypothetical protein P7K49_008514 [Saguinus oedipus]|uniref:Uncharacterized protein n=1 Tax=Saguinus oedipus TaxID=9490 RepID=A0ABQ9W0A6_SAGOE|nr:hypothetical protein P7K49_008514 [Saguinus oedipus]